MSVNETHMMGGSKPESLLLAWPLELDSCVCGLASQITYIIDILKNNRNKHVQ